MHPSRQPLLVGYLLQQPSKRGAFLRAKRREQSILMLPRNLANPAQYLPAISGQVE